MTFNEDLTAPVLTTPLQNDLDAVLPGEDWFLYWRTSPSLWREKLLKIGTSKIVYIPLNWSIHAMESDFFDFGSKRPETDLKKLLGICAELKQRPLILLPLGPSPFLTNGGIPHQLAQGLSKDDRGMAYVIADSEGNLNKLYSFFGPTVYQGWRRFIKSFALYLEQEGLACEVWGMDCGRLEHGQFQSFLLDNSEAFLKSFDRYRQNLEESKDVSLEKMLKDFNKTLYEMYLETSKDFLGAYWEGHKKYVFIGSSGRDFFLKSTDKFGVSKVLHDYLRALSEGCLPSSILVPVNLKKSPIVEKISEISKLIIHSDYSRGRQTAQHNVYEKFSHFCYVGQDDDIQDLTGLKGVINLIYPWSYVRRSLDELKALVDEGEVEFPYYFFPLIEESKTFSMMIRLFMCGTNVLVDFDRMNEEYKKRVEVFVKENGLKEEKVKSISLLSVYSLGEGRIIFYYGNELKKLKLDKRQSFWPQLLNALEIKSIPVDAEEGLEVLWRKKRESFHEGIHYEEVRRADIFNPTSYKKKLKIGLPKNAVLLKIVDQRNSEFKNSMQEIEIKLLPGGMIHLDFGLFS